MLIQGADKKAIKKILFSLTKDLVIFAIKQNIMDEFLKQKLDVLHEKQIKEWFAYLDQKEYGLRLNKMILKEVNNYLGNRETIDEFIDRMFKKKELQIEFIADEEISLDTAKLLLGYA